MKTLTTLDLIAQEVLRLIKKHDWYYSFSDDHRVYNHGMRQEERIWELAMQLPQEQIDLIWKEHVPAQFTVPVSTFNSFPN